MTPVMSDSYEKKLNELRTLEKLIDLGGFFKEEVEKEIRDFFSKRAVKAAEKYYPIGKGFCNHVRVVEAASKLLFKYSVFRDPDSNSKDPLLCEDKDFIQWVLEQTSRINASPELMNKKGFWKNWNISEELKASLEELNPLDERILYLISGLEGDEKASVEKIAKLPEFDCDFCYIAAVSVYLKHLIDRYDENGKNYMNECELHRVNREMEGK